MSASQIFPDLPTLAKCLQDELKEDNKRFTFLYGYNGTGKTRLSGAFRDIGKEVDADGETIKRDTLYFNAFTEDLFIWDNDLKSDQYRVLELNDESKFFNGLRDFTMDVKIGQLMERYANFDFRIEFDREAPAETPDRAMRPAVLFFREREADNTPIPIKISRGEENLFIWCFFLAIVELAIAGEAAYDWVEYLYIDDPISSLDEQNSVAIAVHLASILKADGNKLKTVVSTHHPLFFNVIYNEFNRIKGRRFFFLGRSPSKKYYLSDTTDTPFFHHVASLLELHTAARNQQIFTYHFNQLRVLMEKTASFLGYDKFERCVVRYSDDQDGLLHTRLVNLLSHGKYSLYEPMPMGDENKLHFNKMLANFTERFLFNPVWFPPLEFDEENEEGNTNTSELESETLSPEEPASPTMLTKKKKAAKKKKTAKEKVAKAKKAKKTLSKKKASTKKKTTKKITAKKKTKKKTP